MTNDGNIAAAIEIMKTMISESTTGRKYISQFEHLKVESVFDSWAGAFYKFAMDERKLVFQEDKQIIINADEDSYKLGFVLFLENGKVDTLEVFSYSDNWAGLPSGLKIVDVR